MAFERPACLAGVEAFAGLANPDLGDLVGLSLELGLLMLLVLELVALVLGGWGWGSCCTWNFRMKYKLVARLATKAQQQQQKHQTRSPAIAGDGLAALGRAKQLEELATCTT